MSRPKNSQWFDQSKRLDLPPKKKAVKGAKGVNTPERVRVVDSKLEMVELGVNCRGQLVSVNRRYYDKMLAEYGEKNGMLMMLME